ncbi:NAD(+) diphosphatase [Catenovulum sp. 2E275]|uniref:NAD(+) diphosphatase n=1 Tax=Catenovulum sp. 2E275 TaxID=2980497 RepID=UPI0021CE2C53|nr:NAD(+) diphosphatase [Catenovulum sp. 2E275]MCU4676384.1 NAD(+) diphosphatase [Catenovulum sp. 2E275]
MQINQLVTIDFHQPAFWIIVRNDEIFVSQDAPFIPLYQASDIFNAINVKKATFLGQYANHNVFMLKASQVAIKPEILGEFVELRDFITECDFELFGFAAKAIQFLHFLDTHRFCGRCSQKMKHVGWEMAMQCKQCAHRCYPRLSPCVIMAVVKGDSLLLAVNKKSRSGRSSILAGFVEPGETLELAVAREVYEETAIEVKNIQYFSSQAWPFPHQLMVGFIAEYHSGEIKVDEKEILHADWYNLNDLPETPGIYSIAGQLIEFVKHQKQKSLT